MHELLRNSTGSYTLSKLQILHGMLVQDKPLLWVDAAAHSGKTLTAALYALLRSQMTPYEVVCLVAPTQRGCEDLAVALETAQKWWDKGSKQHSAPGLMLTSELAYPSHAEQQHITIRQRETERTKAIQRYSLFGQLSAAEKRARRRQSDPPNWPGRWWKMAKWYLDNKRNYADVRRHESTSQLYAMTMACNQLKVVIATPTMLMSTPDILPRINHMVIDDCHLINHCDIHCLHEKTATRSLLAFGSIAFEREDSIPEHRPFDLLPNLARHLCVHAHNAGLEMTLRDDFVCHPEITRVVSTMLHISEEGLTSQRSADPSYMFTSDDCLFPLPNQGYPIALLHTSAESIRTHTWSTYNPRQCSVARSLIHHIGTRVPQCKSIGIAAAFAGDRNWLAGWAEHAYGRYGTDKALRDVEEIHVLPIEAASACRYDALIVVTGSTNANGGDVADYERSGQDNPNVLGYRNVASVLQRGTELTIVIGDMDKLTDESMRETALFRFISFASEFTPIVDATNFVEASANIDAGNPPRYFDRRPYLLDNGNLRLRPLIVRTRLNEAHDWMQYQLQGLPPRS
jgi:hypothetical protein